MLDYETKEPEYIEESRDIMVLKDYYTHGRLGIQKGAWNLGFTLLTHTIYLMYEHTLFSHLVNRSSIHNESVKYSQNMLKVIEINDWSQATGRIAYNVMKKILRYTNIEETFINKLSLNYKKPIKRDSPEFCLPTAYKKLDKDNISRCILVKWIVCIKNTTQYKSQGSIRLLISFIIKFLEYNNISVAEYPQVKDLSVEKIKTSIKEIQPCYPLRKKVSYLIAFICYVLEYIEFFDELNTYKKTTPIIAKKTQEESDQHRISKEELEKMYEATKDNIKYMCIFLLMISTGLRVGGVSNIKLVHITTTINDVITVNKTGRTIEKGNKWFTFPISEKLSNLLYTYITTSRESNSSYLFPGRGEDIGLAPCSISNIIKKIATKAGLSGKHIHAHSIRHSFAHILLETGNKPELVSKMLGHTSTATTEQYYLKESAVEASERMDIPWLERKEFKNPVPDFLNEKKEKKTKKDRNKILKSLAKDLLKNSPV